MAATSRHSWQLGASCHFVAVQFLKRGLLTRQSRSGQQLSHRFKRSVHDEGAKSKNWEQIHAPGKPETPAVSAGEAAGPQWTVGDEVTYSKKCDPYEQGGLPLSTEQIDMIRSQVPEWALAEDSKSISREWLCEDFPSAVSFLQKISVLSLNEGHTPANVSINAARGAKRALRIVLHTSRLGGLSYADFMLALKINFVR